METPMTDITAWRLGTRGGRGHAYIVRIHAPLPNIMWCQASYFFEPNLPTVRAKALPPLI